MFLTHENSVNEISLEIIPSNTEITEVNLSAFVHWLFHEDFSAIYGSRREIFMK